MTEETRRGRYGGAALALGGGVLLYMAAGAREAMEAPFLGVMRSPDFSICRVFPESPAALAGFRKFDKVISVDGIRVEKAGHLHGRPPADPGDVRRYLIEREGRPLELEVKFTRPPARVVYLRLGTSIVGLCFVAAGLYVFLRRESRLAAVFFLMCLSVGVFLSSPPRPEGTMARTLLHLVEIAAAFSFASLFLYLFLLFPKRKRILERQPWVVRAVFGVALLCALPLFLTVFSTTALGLDLPRRVPAFLNTLAALTIEGYLALGLAAFLHSYFTTPPGRLKRYLRLMLAASLLGVLPVAAYSVSFAIDPYFELPLEEYVALLMVLGPIAYGYAILRLEPEARAG